MKFLGVPIFSRPPIVCHDPYAACPEHGFGIGMLRGHEISVALATHAELCQNEQTGTVDWPKLVAGPAIDLHTAAEVLFAGYCLSCNTLALAQWQIAKSHQAALGELVGDMSAQQQVKNGAIFNFGQGPVQD